MRASRLVSVLLLLQGRGRMTARELADELEVSRRTVYRDLDELGAAGVPVYAERGAAGGYRLIDGYRTRLTGLNAEEAQSLFLSGLEGPAAQLGLGTVLAAAQRKGLAALPPELRGRAARIRERFVLEAPGWFRRDEEVPCLGTVAEGVWESKRVDLTYDGPDGVVRRRVEPLGLVLKAGTWYLVARRDGLFRTYRVSRMREATCLDERFERPAAFDLARHWEAASAAFAESLRRVAVDLVVRRDSLDDLDYAVGGLRPDAGPEPVEGRDGWVRVRYRASSAGQAHDDLLRLGANAEVLGPPELREMLAATVARLARTYASRRGPGPRTAGRRGA